MSLRGDRLRELRLQRGFTQEELASRLELGIRQIHRYENYLSDPAGKIIAKIAVELNTSADYLLGLTDNPLPVLQTADFSPKEIQLLHSFRNGRYELTLRIVQAEINRLLSDAGGDREDGRAPKPRKSSRTLTGKH